MNKSTAAKRDNILLNNPLHSTRRNVARIILGSLTLMLVIGVFAFTPSDDLRGPLPPGSTWFPQYDFDPATFQKPSLSFGPMARWWWPGNFVTKDELKREINLFADHGFAGVEVQPLNIALPPLPKTERDKVTSWDTPDYYDNLRTVMEAARQRGLIVDVTNGSGWPPSAPVLQPEDGFLSLEFSDTTITGGRSLSFPLPLLSSSKNRTKAAPQLQAVVIANMLPKAAGNDQTFALNAASSKVITPFSQNGLLTYSFSAGTWQVIAFWSVPSGELPSLAATPKSGPVVDHLNTQKVLKLYNYLFGERTGLAPYFGNPLRAVFSDSYEFKTNRHYSPDLIDWFKTKRGYDITPYLPANMQRGYNYVAFMRPNAKPDFSFSDQDWRLRYDYDRTIGELVGEHFFKTSRTWAESRNLLFRTQGYGLYMDMMAMAGLASIPETESMLGPEANLKIMTSGAHLYNRPIVSAESVVFTGRAYTTTPQKIRLAVDKLFAAGVNQIIYHGVPYRYTPKEFGPEGWYPFSSSYLGAVNFSSNLGEGNIYWKYQKYINDYISRTQYALRSGKPHTDVLIYFPFTSVEGMPDNPDEIMTKGYLPGIEAPLPASKEVPDQAKEAWAAHVYPLINQLEAKGISWEWVNDASLQQAQLSADRQLTIRGNRYQALILADSSTIQLPTAQQINTLATKGMKLLAVGTLPTKQPSFLNWQVNDTRTAQLIVSAVKQKNSHHIQQATEAVDWIQSLPQAVKFTGSFGFTRQLQREMSDGSRIQFLWNKSDQWQTISISLAKKYTGSYWLNAEIGTITTNSGPFITYRIAPYGSVILYASTKKTVPATILSTSPTLTDGGTVIHQFDKWDIQADSLMLKGSPLFDWKTKEAFKYSSAVGVYTSIFNLASKKPASRYFLDLGKVYFTAEVTINGKTVGQRIFAPYQVDITPFVQTGTNQIEVIVTPTQLNGFIGKAATGDARYKQFKSKTDQLMSAGLEGPVRLLEK